jgi:hypothetical protein
MAKGRTLDEFCNNHDKKTLVPRRIKTALEQLGDSWEYEKEFIKRCQISQTEMGQFREGFNEHVVELGGRNSRRVWAGTVKFAKKLRERLQ